MEISKRSKILNSQTMFNIMPCNEKMLIALTWNKTGSLESS